MFSNLLQLLRRRRCGGKCSRNTKGDAGGDCQARRSNGFSSSQQAGKKKIKGSRTWKCLRATESDDVSSAAPSRKKTKKRCGLVKNQSVAELQSGGNQEASYAAEPSSGCNEAVVWEWLRGAFINQDHCKCHRSANAHGRAHKSKHCKFKSLCILHTVYLSVGLHLHNNTQKHKHTTHTQRNCRFYRWSLFNMGLWAPASFMSFN